MSARGILAAALRGNLVPDPLGRTGRVGSFPTGWTPSTGGLTVSVVGVRNVGPFRCFDIRAFGTTTGTSLSLRYSESPRIAAVPGDVHDLSTFLTLVDGSFANILFLYLHTDHYDAGGAYIGGNYDGTSGTLPLAASRLPIHKARHVRPGVTVSTALTASMAAYMTFETTVSAAIDFTARFAMPRVALA